MEIIKKYLRRLGNYKGISLEILNTPEVAKIIREYSEDIEPNYKILDEMFKK